MDKEEPIELIGTVTDALGNSTFRVEVRDGHEVIAKIAGKMRGRRRIRVLPNDRVKVEVSPYDLERGRIVWRFRD